MRPVLKPALRRLWRDSTALQLGADPARAVVLDGVDASATAVLALLDGTRRTDDVVTAAVGTGMSESYVRGLLGLLGTANVLDDAATAPRGLALSDRARLEPDLATLTLLTTQPGAGARSLDARREASVLVVGAGRIGSLVTALLAAAGVGHVAVRDERLATVADAVPGGLVPADDGQPRAIAAVAAAQRAGGTSVDGAVRMPDAADCRRADLAVVAADGWLAPHPALAGLFGIVGLPYLLAGVRETCGVVGPLVLPGRTSCACCHDLHRADRDPGWPAIAAQLATDARGCEPACDVTLAAGVAALAAGQVLAHLIGPGLTRCVDATLELRLPEWAVRRRSWAAHPDCPCGAAANARTDAVAARAAAMESASAGTTGNAATVQDAGKAGATAGGATTGTGAP